MNFRRSLPEIRCLSQGLPRGIRSPLVVPQKRLSTRAPKVAHYPRERPASAANWWRRGSSPNWWDKPPACPSERSSDVFFLRVPGSLRNPVDTGIPLLPSTLLWSSLRWPPRLSVSALKRLPVWFQLPRLQLLWQHRIPFRRRVEGHEQFQAAAQVAAGHLARAGFHVDIAASAVQVERQRIFEGLARVFLEQLGLLADVGLAALQRLLEMPALFIHFAVDFGAQLFADGAEKTLLHILGPALRHYSGQGVVELVVVVGNLDIFHTQDEYQQALLLAARAGNVARLGGAFEGRTVHALAVALLDIWGEDDAHAR